MTAKTTGTILVINTGASSVKFQLFDRSPILKRLARGSIVNLSSTTGFATAEEMPAFAATDERTHVVTKKTLPMTTTRETALNFILEWIEKQSEDWRMAAIVHRVVHGGDVFKNSVKITPEVIGQLRALSPLAPLQMPHNLASIEIIAKGKPDAVQVACFDTAFHANNDRLFTEYALPAKIRSKGVRRYGFHGLSYEWVATLLKRDEPTLARGRVIVAHLGNGASLCAMRDAASMDTTMGMTALEGLPTGTRSGNLDPGALLYMIRQLGLSAEDAENCLYNESGLLGLSGRTGDVKLLQDDKDNPKAQFALDYFALKAAQSIAAMAVSLGGMDGIVFTGGIGENSVFMREKILDRIAFLKPFDMRIIPTNEERMMATHAQTILLAAVSTATEDHGDEDDNIHTW